MRHELRNLCFANTILPLGVAALAVAGARSDRWALPALLGLVVVILGLALVSLAAPLLLWRRHGPRALLPLALLLVAAPASKVALELGTRWRLSGTPARPDTFLTEATRRELQPYAAYLLSGGSIDSVAAPLAAYGFTRVGVDTSRRVVTLAHAHFRQWHEYLYAPEPLGAPYSTPPVLTGNDIGNWGALRSIARGYDDSSGAARRGLAFRQLYALGVVRRALGDAVVAELARNPARRITVDEKRRMLEELNGECRFESGLIEDFHVSYGGAPPDLRLDGRPLARGSWAPWLCRTLMHGSVLRPSANGRRLEVRADTTQLERNAVAWLQVGLLDEIFAGLLNANDYVYDRELDSHWYYRRR